MFDLNNLVDGCAIYQGGKDFRGGKNDLGGGGNRAQLNIQFEIFIR